MTLAGYLFGNIPWVKDNLDKIIWAAILLPGVLVLIGALAGAAEAASDAGLSLRGAEALGARCRAASRLGDDAAARSPPARLRADRAGLLLIDGATAVDALEELRGGAAGARVAAQAPTSTSAAPRAALRRRRAASLRRAGAVGSASCSPTVSGRIRRQRPRVLMSTTIGVTSSARGRRVDAPARGATQRRIHSAVSRT